MPRHRKPDRELTKAKCYLDRHSFVDIHGMEFLAGVDMTARREQVYNRDRGRCMLIASLRCRGWAGWWEGEADHVVSRGKGGSDDLSNLRWACKPCHRFRHVRVRFGESKSTEVETCQS